jgi:hypothetical protein
MVAKILERPTLVLNRNWQPVDVATVERALTMLWNESARVVDPETTTGCTTGPTGRNCARPKASCSSRRFGCGCACRKRSR